MDGDKIDMNRRLEEAFGQFINKLAEIQSNFLAGLSNIRKENDEEVLSNLRKKDV